MAQTTLALRIERPFWWGAAMRAALIAAWLRAPMNIDRVSAWLARQLRVTVEEA